MSCHDDKYFFINIKYDSVKQRYCFCGNMNNIWDKNDFWRFNRIKNRRDQVFNRAENGVTKGAGENLPPT